MVYFRAKAKTKTNKYIPLQNTRVKDTGKLTKEKIWIMLKKSFLCHYIHLNL